MCVCFRLASVSTCTDVMALLCKIPVPVSDVLSHLVRLFHSQHCPLCDSTIPRSNGPHRIPVFCLASRGMLLRLCCRNVRFCRVCVTASSSVTPDVANQHINQVQDRMLLGTPPLDLHPLASPHAVPPYRYVPQPQPTPRSDHSNLNVCF